MIALGATRSPHGVHGAIKVHSFSGETDHFRGLSSVELRRDGKSIALKVVSVEIHHQTPVIFFQDVETPEAARRYCGWEIWVESAHAAPLTGDEFYIADLIGLQLQAQGREIARVTAVFDGAQAPLLEVAVAAGDSRRLVPFMAPYIGRVDIEAGSIELEAPWVLDIE